MENRMSLGLLLSFFALLFSFPVITLYGQDVQPAGSLKQELEDFWKNEGEKFFKGDTSYYSGARLAQEIAAIRAKAKMLQDEKLKNAIENINTSCSSGGRADLKENYENFKRISSAAKDVEEILKSYVFFNDADKSKLLNILSNLKRLSFRLRAESFDLEGNHLKMMPLSRKYKKIYSFAEQICKANNLETPYIYINNNRSTRGFFINSIYSGRPIVCLNARLLIEEVSAIVIQQTIAHELGHYYYGDGGCDKFSPEKLKNINYFKEYRADLFAASYGYIPERTTVVDATSKVIGRKDVYEKYLFEPYLFEPYSTSLTHPNVTYIDQQLKDLPSQEQFKTESDRTYRIINEPYYLKYKDLPESTRTLKPGQQRRFEASADVSPAARANTLGLYLKPLSVEVTTPMTPGKIINTTAQPLRPVSARTAQTAAKVLQVAKRLPK